MRPSPNCDYVNHTPALAVGRQPTSLTLGWGYNSTSVLCGGKFIRLSRETWQFMETIRRYGAVLAMTMTVQTVREAGPGLTIYNQGFAVVRDTVPLDLKAGANEIRFTNNTAHLEPDSVILRDPTGKHTIQIIEQNFRGDPVSQPLLLQLHEGKTIDFLVERQGQPPQIVNGRLIRAPYVIHSSGMRRYGREY